MWKQKIGMSVGGFSDKYYSVPAADAVRMLNKIGFDAISPVWGTDELYEFIGAARECGMIIQSLHAPCGRIADMWSSDPQKYELALKELFLAIEDCKRFDIPILVVHTWIGFEYCFDAQAIYFDNFDKIVKYAEANNIKIAFENTEGQEYLFALMEHYSENETVGFCWDAGHEMCYNHSEDLLSRFGDRLIMTHLNDNLGISRFDGNISCADDLHLLPYDGIADWNEIVKRLRGSSKLDILNFELKINSKPNRHENDLYSRMTLEQYFTEAYKRACKIAYQYSK